LTAKMDMVATLHVQIALPVPVVECHAPKAELFDHLVGAGEKRASAVQLVATVFN